MVKKQKAKKNTAKTPKNAILKQLNEPRPLPMGQAEFDEWVDRLQSGVGNLTATRDSLAFAWAEMIMHLGPTEDHKPDVHFIKAARKAAANQVAWANMERLRAEAKARLAAAELAKEGETSDTISDEGDDSEED